MNKLSNKYFLNNKRIRIPNLNNDNSSSTSSSTNKDIKLSENGINNINNIKLFKKQPNLKLKQNILESNDNKGFNDLFEVFTSLKDNNQYLISPNNMNYNLDIISLNNNQLIQSLKGHNNNITMVRYFTNKKIEYLISADINNIVIIWNISDINIEKYKIKLKYNNWIYSCLLLFNYDEINIITSCCGIGNTKVYLFKDKKITFLRNIKNSKNNNVYYLLAWYNEKNKNNYIIEFCKRKIVINNINKNKLYSNLISENVKDSCYITGFLFNSFLFSNSMNGYVNIWDLYENKLINHIFVNNSILTNLIQWNEKYIILINGNKNSIIIIDYYHGIIISNIFSQHEKGILFIKKIEHPIYGESLLTSGQDGFIKLWLI